MSEKTRDMVPLPLDMDDEPIHIGDEVYRAGDHTIGVVAEIKMVLDAEGCMNEVLTYSKLNKRYYSDRPHTLRHYRKPTVEDVLREFLGAVEESVRKGYFDVPNDVYAAYAAKLQLKEEE